MSLDDDLMRIFATDRMKAMLNRLGLPDDMPIEHGMVSKAIESAQGKVEGHNFDIRKHLLDYDDVLNKHRETVYRRRAEILHASDTAELVMASAEREIKRIIQFHTAGDDRKAWNFTEIDKDIRTIFPLPSDAEAKLKEFADAAGSGGKLGDVEARDAMIKYLIEIATAVRETLKKQFTDKEMLAKVEQAVMLRSIDQMWIEHLDNIDHLRAGIGLRGYGQRDPLVEYKREAFRMFGELLLAIDKQVAGTVFKVGFAASQNQQSLFDRRGITVTAPAKTSDQITNEGGVAKEAATSIENEEKIGRNDLCPCGSGKKYKKCHGK